MKKIVKHLFTALAVICAAGGITVSSGRLCISETVYASSVNENAFAYAQLTDEEKSVYEQLYEGIAGRNSKFNISAKDSELIKPALSAILCDCPEFFWIDGTASMTGFQYLGKWDIELGFNIPDSEIAGNEALISEKVSAFLASLPADASDYRKAKSAYEYVIENTDYDLDADQNQNIQSVFLNGQSVCAGYARAYQYLCHQMGLECAYIEGTVDENGTPEGHAWNLVKLDNSYVYVDPSWGDPTYCEDETDAGRLEIIYDYFGLTTDELLRAHHTPNGDYELPECTDHSYDYYRINDLFYEYAEVDRISNAIWKAVDQNERSVFMKFASEGEYYDACSMLFPGDSDRGSLMDEPLQKRMEWDEVSSIRYYYSCSDELWIIKIYW